jgi:hypothetical protein
MIPQRIEERGLPQQRHRHLVGRLGQQLPEVCDGVVVPTHRDLDKREVQQAVHP